MKTKTTRTIKSSKTRTLVRLAGPARRLRDLLDQSETVTGKELWKRYGESPTIVPSRTDPKFADEWADLSYLSKDRTHCTLIDLKLADTGVLTPRQAFLYLNQLAHLRKNLDYPLASASLLFVLPEGSPLLGRLTVMFDESYKLPTVLLRNTSMSEARISGRGSRLAKNMFRYTIAVNYKEEKFELKLAVKVVEAPEYVFETTRPFGKVVFVPIPGSRKP